MQTTDSQKRFTQYYQLADRIIDAAAKGPLAEVARILSIHVAHYRGKYGKVSMEETLKLLHSVTVTDEELGMAAEEMEHLVTVLGGPASRPPFTSSPSRTLGEGSSPPRPLPASCRTPHRAAGISCRSRAR